MERERTLMDHGVGFGFVLYLKVEEGEHYVDLTGVVAEGDGGTRVRVSRVRRSEDGGWSSSAPSRTTTAPTAPTIDDEIAIAIDTATSKSIFISTSRLHEGTFC